MKFPLEHLSSGELGCDTSCEGKQLEENRQNLPFLRFIIGGRISGRTERSGEGDQCFTSNPSTLSPVATLELKTGGVAQRGHLTDLYFCLLIDNFIRRFPSIILFSRPFLTSIDTFLGQILMKNTI